MVKIRIICGRDVEDIPTATVQLYEDDSTFVDIETYVTNKAFELTLARAQEINAVLKTSIDVYEEVRQLNFVRRVEGPVEGK